MCSTGLARANGRFPKAQVIATVPGSDGKVVFLRTTFGILVSGDGGASFRWICERALGYGGQWDPPIAATRDGRLWVGLESGLSSTPDGCAVETAAELAGETVRDLTTDLRGETLWVLAGAPGRPSHVWRKKVGAAFERLGSSGLEGVNVMTIEVAPSAPSRLWVSGQPYDTIRGRLYASDDGGRTFSGRENALAAEGPFFIAEVDHANADRVLVRHLHTTGSDLLVTTDGGRTFRATLSMESAMFGFAKTADGKTLWAGSGLPEHGIHRSTDGGEHWEKISARGVLCLHAPAAPKDRLFACENTLALGASAVARSDDRGASFRSLGTFGDVRGPVACASDAAAPLCGGVAWEELRAFVMPRAEVVPRDAGAPRTTAEPRSRCACDVAVGARAPVDPSLPIVGVLALGVRAFSRRKRGSRRVQGSAEARDTAGRLRW